MCFCLVVSWLSNAAAAATAHTLKSALNVRVTASALRDTGFGIHVPAHLDHSRCLLWCPGANCLTVNDRQTLTPSDQIRPKDGAMHKANTHFWAKHLTASQAELHAWIVAITRAQLTEQQHLLECVCECVCLAIVWRLANWQQFGQETQPN